MSILIIHSKLKFPIFKQKKKMILIIDNQNVFIRNFVKKYMVESGIDHMMIQHNDPIVIPDGKDVKGIILSGGKGSPYTPLNLTANFVALMNYEVPIMGFCLSHEIIAIAYGGHIEKLDAYYKNHEVIRILKDDPLLGGIDKKEIKLERRHSFHVSQLPETFFRIAESDITPNEIIKHKTKPIYGLQGHPEASGKTGLIIMENFFRLCGVLG